MHFLIIRETPLSLFMSILGLICAMVAIMIGGMAYEEASAGWWLACLGFGVATFLFYFIALRTSKKARKRRLETEREYAQKEFKLSSGDHEDK